MKIFLSVMLAANAAFGVAESKTSAQQQFLRQFASSRIEFPNEDSLYRNKSSGRYPGFLKIFFQNILGWIPAGEGRDLSETCSTELWGKRLQDPRIRDSVQLQGAILQKYFRDCAEQLENGVNGSLKNLTRMMSTKFEPESNPFVHPLVFHLPGNVKLKGLLALKGDFKKRPLVIVRLGVFSNVQEFLPERPWFMMLFDQSPFNVLLVENMSSTDFIENNSRFAFGGYDEGIQNILIAQMLKDPNEPLNRLVESLHLFGASLGGHGVFFASLLNGLNSPPRDPLYASFVAMCPVVHLQPTMNALTTSAPFSYAVDLWARKRLSGLREKISAVNDHAAFSFLDKTVSEVARTYSGGISYISSVKLPVGYEDGPQFWKLNDFWPSYKKVAQPVLVFATHDDPIVPFSVNSESLQNHETRIESTNLSVVDLPRGVHCSLPIAYDWRAISTILQSYVLSHSPGFQVHEQSFEMELGDFKSNPEIKMRVLPFEAKNTFVKLELVVKSSQSETEKLKMSLPLSEFDFRFLNSELSPSEEWMIERWVHQNLRLLVFNRDGKSYVKATWRVAL